MIGQDGVCGAGARRNQHQSFRWVRQVSSTEVGRHFMLAAGQRKASNRLLCEYIYILFFSFSELGVMKGKRRYPLTTTIHVSLFQKATQSKHPPHHGATLGGSTAAKQCAKPWLVRWILPRRLGKEVAGRGGRAVKDRWWGSVSSPIPCSKNIHQ